jgi:hypothetical protein
MIGDRLMTAQIARIVSGGETGADRAALDFAIEHGIPYGGWCPRGGWAEDMTEPPGLLARYPNLRETPGAELDQRTRWNVRDSDCLLLFTRGDADSPGSELTQRVAARLERPSLVVSLPDPSASAAIGDWLAALPGPVALDVAGPRESEAPGIYRQVRHALEASVPARP